MNVDFDKLLTDYLNELDIKNPNPSNDLVTSIALTSEKQAAKTCVEILKRYEELKSND